MTEAQMIEVMARAISAIDECNCFDRREPCVACSGTARAALDAIREHVTIEKEARGMTKQMSDEEIVRGLADITLATTREGIIRNAALDLIQRLTAERDAAFRAGAEGMREASAGAMRGKDAAEFYRQLGGLLRAEELIRALPLPAHQSTGDAT